MTSTNRCLALFACTAGLLVSPLLWAAEPQPGLSYGANIKITGQSIDDLDLGTRDGGDFNGAGLSIRPWVYGLRGDWSAYLMGEAFVAIWRT